LKRIATPTNGHVAHCSREFQVTQATTIAAMQERVVAVRVVSERDEEEQCRGSRRDRVRAAAHRWLR
jgi:hypothetical protein